MYTRILEAGVTAPVTVPIRASLGARSVAEIKEFMDKAEAEPAFPPVTLTIWSAVLDLVDMQGLEELVLTVGKDKVCHYYHYHFRRFFLGVLSTNFDH